MTTERSMVDVGHAHVVAQVLLARLQERGVQPTHLKVEATASSGTRGDVQTTDEMSVRLKLWNEACFGAVCDALRTNRCEESSGLLEFDMLGCGVQIVHVTGVE